MKRKGFTLIELLAVIVILAIIALISTPIIISVLERARKGAFEDSAYGVIDAAKLYYADASLDGKVEAETFNFPADTKLKLSGTKPKSGSVTLEEDGKVSIAISNGEWCAVKTKDEEKVTIKDYSVGECIVENVETPSTPETCFTVNENDPSEITGYTCTNKSITIPSTINGTEIKKIGDNAFYNKGITSVEIKEGITSIGNGAFANNQLTSISLPSTIETIGENAFANNQEGMKVTINKPDSSIPGAPWGGTSIEWTGSCFTVSDSDSSMITGYTCTDTVVEIPSTINGVNITKIGENTFKEKNLTSVTIPEGITDIKQMAFYKNKLTSIKLPDSIINMENFSFSNNLLGSLSIPKNVKKIGNSAFSYNQLTSIVIPDNVTLLDNFAFANNQLTSITIGKGITTINESAFVYNQLANIIIPNHITVIGPYAFEENQLTSIVIPDNVIDIGKRAFLRNQLTSVTIGKKVENIGAWAFRNNQLESIVIPSNVLTIGESAFALNKTDSAGAPIMKVIVNKPKDSIAGGTWQEGYWGAASVEWNG